MSQDTRGPGVCVPAFLKKKNQVCGDDSVIAADKEG